MPWQPGMRHGWGALFRSPTAASPPAPGWGTIGRNSPGRRWGSRWCPSGIPLVVDCRTLLHDLGLPHSAGGAEDLVVTPKDVDLLIDRGAHPHRHGGEPRRPTAAHRRGDRSADCLSISCRPARGDCCQTAPLVRRKRRDGHWTHDGLDGWAVPGGSGHGCRRC